MIIINDYSRIDENMLLNSLLGNIALSYLSLCHYYSNRSTCIEQITKYQDRKRQCEKWMIDEIRSDRGAKARNKLAVLLSAVLRVWIYRQISNTCITSDSRPWNYLTRRDLWLAIDACSFSREGKREGTSAKKIEAAYAPAFRKRLDAQPLKVTGICTCCSSS